MAYEFTAVSLDRDKFTRGLRWQRFRTRLLRRSRLGPLAYLGRSLTWFFDGLAALLERLHLIRILGALALVVGGPAFLIDLLDRTEERTVRAWQLVTTPAPGNSGKRDALEYLNSQPWYWPLKRRVNLNGVDLSLDRHQGSVQLSRVQLPDAELGRAKLDSAWLSEANFSSADLFQANLSYAFLPRADFSDARLWRANVSNAYLAFADLSRTNLADANLSGANLDTANLSGANLENVDLADADLSRANLTDVRNLSQAQLDRAWAWLLRPPEGLPGGLSIKRLCEGNEDQMNAFYRTRYQQDRFAAPSPPSC